MQQKICNIKVIKYKLFLTDIILLLLIIDNNIFINND